MNKLFISLCILCSAMMLNAQTAKFAGGDISLLPSYEAVNTPYKTSGGATISDVVTYLHDDMHWNAARVRIFVEPCITNADGTKQGEVQDAAYAAALGSRIKAAGMTFMADFHYSDTWADPVKQYIPARWINLPDEILPDTVYAYTKASLELMVAAGATPDFVQIGNEVSYGMLWRGTPNNTVDKANPYSTLNDTEQAAWQRFANLANAGARAVREVCPNAQIIMHCERTASAENTGYFFRHLTEYGVDYDVMGLSYYPFWHGALEKELKNTLNNLHNIAPNKPVQIVETAYNNNYDFAGPKYECPWPRTAAGQAQYLADLVAFLNEYDYVNGLYYWFPEENGNGGATWSASTIVITNWLNRGLWDPSNHKGLPGLSKIADFLPTPTSVEDIATEETILGSSARKMLQDGQLVILRGDKTYTISGSQVR